MPIADRYQSFVPLALPDRAWPDRVLAAAPRWLSTDLRDGNQALPRPMEPGRKLAMFELLTGMGYREIEVGFPVASQDEYDFVRFLIEHDRVPDGVRITVFTPAREELIRRTIEAVRGARSATIHLYNATAPLFRELVFGIGRDECRELAVRGARLVVEQTSRLLDGCDIGFQYSPEVFNETEPEFALEVCEAVADVWEPGPGREIILNFPSTVERSGPHVFADQIEWLDRHLSRREHVCLSIHPHNDRGTGVASAELAMLAGAQRVEGCLFGGGERAGNVCLVTLGLNLLTHGVDPGVDFSDLDRVRDVVEHCTGMRVGARHPYGGDLVFTAFSGAHQDAIKKGIDARRREADAGGLEPEVLPWRMPYLPMDPRDIGRDYEAIVRINSQSGKGGVAYVMAVWHGLRLPRGLQVEFAQRVQAETEATGREVTPDRLRQLFEDEYLVASDPSVLFPTASPPLPVVLHLDGAADEELRTLLAPWGIEVRETVRIEGERRLEQPVAVYAECQLLGRTVWGTGIDRDAPTAAFAAVRAACARGAQPATTLEQAPARAGAR